MVGLVRRFDDGEFFVTLRRFGDGNNDSVESIFGCARRLRGIGAAALVSTDIVSTRAASERRIAVGSGATQVDEGVTRAVESSNGRGTYGRQSMTNSNE